MKRIHLGASRRFHRGGRTGVRSPRKPNFQIIAAVLGGEVMFSVAQKRLIAEKVERILRETNHPELPDGEIQFLLHVQGAESWSHADIFNNGAVITPGANPWNEIRSRE